MATFTCVYCEHSSSAKDKHIGKKVKCPVCQKTGRIENSNSPNLPSPVKNPPPLKLNTQTSSRAKSEFRIWDPKSIFEFLDNNSNLVALLGSMWRIIIGSAGILFLLGWLLQWTIIFKLADSPFSIGFSFYATQIVSLVSAGTAAYIMWFRSIELSTLKSSSNRFVVIPSLAKFVSATGEALAAIILISGISTAFLLASKGGSAASLIPLHFIETDIIRSIAASFVTLVFSVVTAIAVFLAGRLISEMLNVVYSIANDIRMLSENSKNAMEENAG